MDDRDVAGSSVPSAEGEQSAKRRKTTDSSDAPQAFTSPRITINVGAKGTLHVWDPEDVIMMQSLYHVVGCTTGCFPKTPLQDIFTSLPIRLTFAEAAFLRDIKVARFVDETLLLENPTSSQQLLFQELRQRKFNQQQEEFEKEKHLLLEKRREEIFAGKLRKMKANAKMSGVLGVPSVLGAPGVPTISAVLGAPGVPSVLGVPTVSGGPGVPTVSGVLGVPGVPLPEDKEALWQIIRAELLARPKEGKKEGSSRIEIPFRSWKVEMGVAELSEVPFLYPQTHQERVYYAAYSLLMKAGFWTTSGMKYGGDLLLYEGDVHVNHSTCIVRIVDEDEETSLEDILRIGRVATATHKTVLWASVRKDYTVDFTCSKWALMK